MRQLLRRRYAPIRVSAPRGHRDAFGFITPVTFIAAVDPLWHPASCFFFPLLSDIKDSGEPGQVGVCGRAIHLNRHDRPTFDAAPPFVSFYFFHPARSTLQRCRTASSKVTPTRRGRPELRAESHTASSLPVGRGADGSLLSSFSGELIKAKKQSLSLCPTPIIVSPALSQGHKVVGSQTSHM